MTPLNLFVRFPKGTMPFDATPSDAFHVKVRILLNSYGVYLSQRDDDLFQVVGISRKIWRPVTAAIRQVFTGCTLEQRV